MFPGFHRTDQVGLLDQEVSSGTFVMIGLRYSRLELCDKMNHPSGFAISLVRGEQRGSSLRWLERAAVVSSLFPSPFFDHLLTLLDEPRF